MKKIISIILILFSIIFVSCGNIRDHANEGENNSTITSYEKDDEQAILNDKLEKEAVKADFVSLNGNTEQNFGLRVFAEGKISVVDYNSVMDVFPSFMLSQEEGDGYGIYHVSNALSVPDLKDGDYVKVYGLVDGTNNVGMIKILATVVELENK